MIMSIGEVMTANKCKVLHDHDIRTKIVENRLQALSTACLNGRTINEWLDVDAWSIKTIMAWLGY
jgi:hypothetical protein